MTGKNLASKCHFVTSISRVPSTEDTLFIVDSLVAKKYSKALSKRKEQRVRVKSGEKLKNLESLQNFLHKNLSSRSSSQRSIQKISSFGGGSVGDFSGFLASIYRRGVAYDVLPSTWLAAIDSAHGGKTALNVGGYKNQIGTFFPADNVWLVKEVLMDLPPARLKEAWGEVIKIGLIEGGSLWKKILSAGKSQKQLSNQLWKLLPDLVQAKMRIVRQDPFEKKGLRRVLNLGHSAGHIFEARLGLPHGMAVQCGLWFSLLWSKQRGHLTESQLQKISQQILQTPFVSFAEYSRLLQRIKNPKVFIKMDKKQKSKNEFHFIFIKSPGRVYSQAVSYENFLQEWKRQQGLQEWN